MIGAAQDHAAQRRDIAEIPAPGHGDVVRAREAAVGGIELDPAVRRAPHRHPGVRRRIADQLLTAFSRSGIGAQVAAHVARRQAARTQAGDHEMREVLADAAPGLHHFGR